MSVIPHFNNPEDLINYLNKPYQVHPVKLKDKVANSLELTPHQKSVLAGTLLGDGSLRAPLGNAKNVRFNMKHSIKQVDWIHWKGSQFFNLSSKRPFQFQEETVVITNPVTKKKSTNNKLHQKVLFKTRCLRCLTEFHKEISTDKEFDFKKPWLNNYIDDQALMIWWLDDGGKQGTGSRSGKLATHGFDPAALLDLQALLRNKWGINTTVQRAYYNSTNYFYLQLSPENLKKLLLVIMKHIPVGSMLYKAVLEYKDQDIQKHWICTMYKEIKPELHADLEKLVGPNPNINPPNLSTRIKDTRQ